jgi:hypothetical protein
MVNRNADFLILQRYMRKLSGFAICREAATVEITVFDGTTTNGRPRQITHYLTIPLNIVRLILRALLFLINL